MDAAFIIGWQEWVSLPELGVCAIKAKVDTGARTSALHAFLIDPFGPVSAPMVRFGVHPIPGRQDVAIMCQAPVIDRRDVTSSNGEKEQRYFIRTEVALGERSWPIEIGLTNRENMAYRMLLGRTALREDMVIDASTSFRQPRLNYKIYRSAQIVPAQRLPLRIMLLSSRANSAFNRSFAARAAELGTTVEAVDLASLSLVIAEKDARLTRDGAPLESYDCVLARLSRQDVPVGAAILRHLQAKGCIPFNEGNALAKVADRLSSAQALVRDGVTQTVVLGTAEGPAPLLPDRRLNVLVIDGDGVVMIDERADRVRKASLTRHRASRRLAEQAAAAVGLRLAGVVIDGNAGYPAVASITANPRLAAFAKLSGEDIAGRLIEAMERLVPSRSRSIDMRDA